MSSHGITIAARPLALAAAAVLGLAATTPAFAETPMERLQADAPKSWGQWGDDDQVGALNYLGAEQVKNGAAAVSGGEIFSLQIPMSHNFGPVFPGRIPMMHYMAQDESTFAAGKKDPLPGGVKFSDDVAFMYLQGTTHVDALGHAWYGERIYGGVSAETTVDGHSHADVAAIGKRGVVGRAVLLDVGRHMGGDDTRLDNDECITLADLKATAEAQGTTIGKRDIVIVRTGSMARYFDEKTNSEWDAMSEPGLCYSHEMVQWFADMETPMIAADNLGVEKVVQEIDGDTVVIPLHGALIRDLGVVLSEIYWLEGLADDSAEDGQYTFMFAAAPLQVEGGTGAPVNPIAIK
ncbi:cyclase family protein [Arhodomonas aquaeolei]|uniref:cyclase family protein n=1 Tax=Arhodomonas aquaeolei TaxID=2369 RepID=UPI0021695EBF|nr:cyclase family protein [Arhodomonas aquaeolei]MCS4504794.1 cyclase family protein [Arhodomonas aquaeolei]